MKLKYVATLVALLLVCVPALAGAQVFQTMTSPEEWSEILPSWKEKGLANDDVASTVVIGVMAHRIAVNQNHPSGKMEGEEYIKAFFQANPALMPEKGLVKLENFLTLARAGKIQHPALPVATPVAANEPAAPEEASSIASPVPANTDAELARFTADAALRQSQNAVELSGKALAEIEKLASRSSADTNARERLSALEEQSAALAALPAELRESQKVAIAELVRKQEASDQQRAAEVAQFKEEVGGQLAAVDAKLAEVAAAPAKGDNFARGVGFAAVAMALLVAFFLYSLFGKNKENKKGLQKLMVRTGELETKVVGHDDHLEKLDKLLQDPKDIVIPEDLKDRLLELSGDRKHMAEIKVDDERFMLVFRTGPAGSIRILGIEGLTTAVKVQNVRSTILRAGRDGRITGVEDEKVAKKVTPISASSAPK